MSGDDWVHVGPAGPVSDWVPCHAPLDVCALKPSFPGQPLWLLDIDGVINAFDRLRPGASAGDVSVTGFEVRTVSTGPPDPCDFQFCASPALVAEIGFLHASGSVEIAWATTWQDAANTEVARIWGLPQLAVAARSRGLDDFEYKELAALEALALGRPLVWTDDDAITDDARRVIASSDVPTLLIEPDPMHGLTAYDLRTIREFVGQFRQ